MIYIFMVNSFVVTVAVMIHYEFLYFLTKYFKKMAGIGRYRIVVGVLGALIAHAIEIWAFALTYYLINISKSLGHLEGNFDGSLMDCAYFSFTVFSTLGFGDIIPKGDLRYLAGIESLTGLLLIAWTASFLYLEMNRQWEVDENKTP